jgi:hypothetical protein
MDLKIEGTTSFVSAFSTGHPLPTHGHEAPVLSRDNNREIKTNAPPDVRTESDLMPEGAAPGTVPTDIEQATGLERLEILGKMEGIDVFDMKPLPSDRMGTLKEPVIVRSFGDEQYCGCTGIPADTHHVKWLTVCQTCQ